MEGWKTYYKLSDYDAYKGIAGHECVNKLIVDRLLDIPGVEHLKYQLIHADVRVNERVEETWLSASEDFKEKGEDKLALDAYYDTEFQPGGYGVTWDAQVSIPDTVLYRQGRAVPLRAADFHSFVTHRVVNAAEAAELLDCSRQNISDLTRKGKLHPIKATEKNTLYLKSEVLRWKWK